MSERVDAVNRPPARIRYGWPLYPDEWEAVPDSLWLTEQWQSRPLGHASRDSLPTQSGVYLMSVKPPRAASFPPPVGDLNEVIYVGKTVNLRRRYAEHLNTPSPKVRMARATYSASLRFWFLALPKSQIAQLEALLIDCFGPPANDRPGDSPHLTLGENTTVQPP